MYAIVDIGSRQIRVSEGDEIEVAGKPAKAGGKVSLDKILLLCDSKTKKLEVGNPYLKKVKVACEVLLSRRGKKVVAFKYRRRKNSQRKRGYRDDLVRLKVKEIKVG